MYYMGSCNVILSQSEESLADHFRRDRLRKAQRCFASLNMTVLLMTQQHRPRNQSLHARGVNAGGKKILLFTTLCGAFWRFCSPDGIDKVIC